MGGCSVTSDERPRHEARDEAADEQAEGVPQDLPDGLDLARSITRATAATPGRPAPRRTSGRRRARPRSAGAHPDDRDPQLLDTSLERLIAARGWEMDLKVQGVFGRWAELVGQSVADHCTPESFSEGRLVVRTDSTAWATQLKLLAPTVVRLLNEELGDGTVTVIEVLGPHLPTWKKGGFGVRGGRGPRDTYG